MFDWIDDAVSGAKKAWDGLTGGGGGSSQGSQAQAGSSPAKQAASQAGSFAEQEKALAPGGGYGGHGQVNQTISGGYGGQGASTKGNAGGGSWWDKLWGDDSKKDEGPVYVPMKTEEPPEPEPGGESYWERERKRKEDHNQKVGVWKEYERERQIIMNKLAEVESRKGFLQRNPYQWSAEYVLQQQIQTRQDEDAARAKLAGLREPPFKRPDPYDYYVI